MVTVGFVVDTLQEEYQRLVFAGLHEEAQRLNVDIRCFVGGPLSVLGAAAHRNRVYDCISAERLDGLVVAAGTLGNWVGAEALTAFVESFANLPTCSVGIDVPGTPSVTPDNHAGIREALVHLIEEGGRRRIAFIRGPRENREAEERFRAYRDVLAEYRLALDPDLITEGDFEAPSGAAAVKTLLDERRVGFDALLASSDLMALGAMNALLERGVSIPARVSVVGFDDIETARFAPAPLTSVRQPLRALGKLALQNVVNQIHGNVSVSNSVLPARLIRRQSSLPASLSHPVRAPEETTEQAALDSFGFERCYRSIQTDLTRQLHRHLHFDGLDPDWAEQLCTYFVQDAGGRRSGLLRRQTFLEYLEQLMLQALERDGDINAFQRIVDDLRERLLPFLQNVPALRDSAEQQWHRARVSIGNIAERYQVQRRLQQQHRLRQAQQIGAELLRCHSFDNLASTLAARLPLLGIGCAAVCTFEPRGHSRLRIAFDQNQIITDGEYEAFVTGTLLPDGVFTNDQRRVLLADTLYSRDRALGYVLMEMGNEDPEVYALLRDYLTGTLRGLVLEPPRAEPDLESQVNVQL